MTPFDEEGIGYGKAAATGAVARLQARLDQGEVRLAHDEQSGYLPAVLDALKVPRSSQMLVFSKTSFQRERISPRNPRALFFNDDVYIGFIPGSPLLEISVADPKLGAVFYTLNQDKNAKPHFVRTDQCLECHASAKTMGVPGHLVRSFATDEDGVVDLSSGTSLVNHRTRCPCGGAVGTSPARAAGRRIAEICSARPPSRNRIRSRTPSAVLKT